MKNLIFIACFIGTNFHLSAQSKLQFQNRNFELIDSLLIPSFKMIKYNPKSIFSIKSRDTYMPTLGIMCRFEEQITKNAKIPVKLRLGSKDYVDYLENKGNF